LEAASVDPVLPAGVQELTDVLAEDLPAEPPRAGMRERCTLARAVRYAAMQVVTSLSRRTAIAGAVRSILNDAGRPCASPASAAERWAMFVFRACASSGDLKTLHAWAACVGVSYTSLRESCRLLAIRPHDARDLTRMLRALMRSYVDECPASALLDVSDSRTLRALLQRAGADSSGRLADLTIDQFLMRQRFVAADNAGMRALRRVLASAAGTPVP
jgi:hypothetical protein